MRKRDRIYVARDKRMDEIGIPINPYGKSPRHWLIELLDNAETAVIAILSIAVIVYILLRMS